MSWDYDMAKAIRAQGKPRETDGYYIAEVVEVRPTKLTLFGGELYITEDMMDKTERWEDVERLTGSSRLRIGQKVAVIGRQRFLILDRVVE